ncbi:MAG: hypothetical protein M1820_009191, partial [Bogoriella megaspora]
VGLGVAVAGVPPMLEWQAAAWAVSYTVGRVEMQIGVDNAIVVEDRIVADKGWEVDVAGVDTGNIDGDSIDIENLICSSNATTTVQEAQLALPLIVCTVADWIRHDAGTLRPNIT